MIVTCEECGKKYRFDPAIIKGSEARFRCKACSHIITVSKPDTEIYRPPPAPQPTPEPFPETLEEEKPPEVKLEEEKLVIEGMSIKSKITLIIVSLVLVSTAVAGFIASYQSRNALSKQAEDFLLTNARQKSKEYGLTFERVKDEVLGIADYATITYGREDIKDGIGMDVLMPWVGSGYGNATVNARLYKEKLILQRIGLVLKSVVSKNPYLSLGYFGSKNGMTVFDNEEVIKVIEKLEAFDVTKRPWYLKAMKSGKTIWTEPYVDANTKKLCVTCASPVFLPDKLMVGVVGFDVLLGTIQKDVLALDIGYDSYAFLVNSKGGVLVRPGMDAKDARWDETYKTDNLLKTNNAEFNNIIGKMIKGRSGVDIYDAGVEDKYAAYSPLRAIGASMAIVAAKDEVIRPAIAIQNLIIMVWVVILLISILVGFILGNNITKPINKLTIMTNLISQGRMDLDVLSEDRKDEIGVLTESFNRLVISLKLAMSRGKMRK